MTRHYIKGKDGRVTVGSTELEVTDHESTGQVDMESFGTSMSEGFNEVVDGNQQCTGSVQGKITAEQVLSDLLEEGDEVALKLYKTQSAPTTGKKIYRDLPRVKISDVKYGSDPNGGGGATFSFSFLSSGPYYTKHEA